MSRGTGKMTRRALAGVLVLALVVAGPVGVTMGIADERATDATDATGIDAEAPATDRQTAADEVRALGGFERQEDDCNYRDLYDAVSRSVVSINASNETGVLGGGSGWVYRTDGPTAYVVTNWHVVFGATDYDLQFAGGALREGELVGADPVTDLAVLRVENAPESAEALEIASERPDRGQSVGAFGNPFGLEESVSTGVVSGTERAITVQYQNNATSIIPDTIQIDAAVNPGNSGGPLVDCQGRVLGVNYAGVGSANVGINFAIAATVVREVVPALVENGSYRHSFLGIRPVEVGPVVAESNDLNVTRGVMVADVLPGGPSDGVLRGAPAVHKRTGVSYGGDVVLAVNETQIGDREDLLTYLLLETDPGDTLNVTVLRDGENRTVEVTLGERPPVVAQPPRTAPGTTTVETPTTEETTAPATTTAEGTTDPVAETTTERETDVAAERETVGAIEPATNETVSV